jgi:hypothetical protein
MNPEGVGMPLSPLAQTISCLLNMVPIDPYEVRVLNGNENPEGVGMSEPPGTDCKL